MAQLYYRSFLTVSPSFNYFFKVFAKILFYLDASLGYLDQRIKHLLPEVLHRVLNVLEDQVYWRLALAVLDAELSVLGDEEVDDSQGGVVDLAALERLVEVGVTLGISVVDVDGLLALDEVLDEKLGCACLLSCVND